MAHGVDISSQFVNLRYAAFGSVILTMIAENCCNYAMFTLDYFGNVIETSLWATALAMVTPYGFQIYRFASKVDKKYANADQIKWFGLGVFAVGFLFVSQLSVDHIPLQYRLW